MSVMEVIAMDIQKLRLAVQDFRFQGKVRRDNNSSLTVREHNELVESIARALDKFVDAIEESESPESATKD